MPKLRGLVLLWLVAISRLISYSNLIDLIGLVGVIGLLVLAGLAELRDRRSRRSRKDWILRIPRCKDNGS